MVGTNPGQKIHKIFGAAVLAICMTFSLNACRFGNNVSTQDNPDIYTGYYESEPQTLQFCVTLVNPADGSTTDTCKQINKSQINNFVPDLVYQVMTNPLAFIIKDWEQGLSYMVSPFGSGKAMPIFFNKDDQTLSLLANNDPAPALWGHPECREAFSLVADGKLTPHEVKTVSGLNTIGRLGVNFTVLDRFDGTCTAATTEMQSCYFDHLTCGGSNETDNLSLQQSVRDFFLPYITSTTMTPSQIGSVKGLGYWVTYQ